MYIVQKDILFSGLKMWLFLPENSELNSHFSNISYCIYYLKLDKNGIIHEVQGLNENVVMRLVMMHPHSINV